MLHSKEITCSYCIFADFDNNVRLGWFSCLKYNTGELHHVGYYTSGHKDHKYCQGKHFERGVWDEEFPKQELTNTIPIQLSLF